MEMIESLKMTLFGDDREFENDTIEYPKSDLLTCC